MPTVILVCLVHPTSIFDPIEDVLMNRLTKLCSYVVSMQETELRLRRAGFILDAIIQGVSFKNIKFTQVLIFP